MGRVAAIGEHALVNGWALAGVDVFVAEDEPSVAAAWDGLPRDVALVLLSPTAEHRLGDRLRRRPELLAAVVPA